MQILMRVLPKELHGRLAYLSGPSFAAEVAAGLPTVVTIAAADDAVAARAQALLSAPRFRCYRTTDVTGVVATRASASNCISTQGNTMPTALGKLATTFIHQKFP